VCRRVSRAGCALPCLFLPNHSYLVGVSPLVA
jgi:hypothetical protein